MPNRNIVFWQRNPSPHQSAYIRAMAELPGIVNVQGVFIKDLDVWRREMGWSRPDFGSVDISVAPNNEAFDALLEAGGAECTHVVSGIIAEPRLRRVLSHARNKQTLIGLLSEGRDWRGSKGLLRSLHSFGCERRYTDDVDFVLAIGHLASKWYRNIGFSPDKIFDFCYVVEEKNDDTVDIACSNSDGILKILFVGQLISRKRVTVLLEALRKLKGAPWKLSIIGDGVEKPVLVSLAKELGISASVEFFGFQDNASVRRAISNADLLALPSHWDGWGAVVNEALMAGTRVVCSDFCGAADLVRDTPYGGVFACDSVDGLAHQLSAQIARGTVSAEERGAIRRYSETITGPVVAQYLREIIEHVSGKNPIRPIPPWKRPLKEMETQP